MNIDGPNRVDKILDEQRAQRPRWYKPASKSAPSWFAGGELDLLAASERDQLFLEVSARERPAWPVLVMLVASNLPNMIRSVLSNNHRALWLCLAAGDVVLLAGAWLARRRIILARARKQVRESANWPLLGRQGLDTQ